MSTTIGPTVHLMTPHSELVCTRCEYHKCTMIHPGPIAQWERLCIHPKMMVLFPTTGAWIGEDPETPEWCPELKRNKQP
jgi:hypothetical protein